MCGEYYTEGAFMSSGRIHSTLFDAHIRLIFSRCCYHNNYKTRTISDMHIFSIFDRLYHINSETDMHIFLCLGRLYHINSQNLFYAFARSRVLF